MKLLRVRLENGQVYVQNSADARLLVRLVLESVAQFGQSDALQIDGTLHDAQTRESENEQIIAEVRRAWERGEFAVLRPR